LVACSPTYDVYSARSLVRHIPFPHPSSDWASRAACSIGKTVGRYRGRLCYSCQNGAMSTIGRRADWPVRASQNPEPESLHRLAGTRLLDLLAVPLGKVGRELR